MKNTSWLEYVHDKADKRLLEIERRVRGRDDEGEDGDEETLWLLGYISFLKGNLRAMKNGLE